MPPKAKETAKKVLPTIFRPDISSASLNYVPDDAIEGYQDRIETGIDWTIEEQAARHRKKSFYDHLTEITFSQALQNKINNSILNGFLDKNSNISLSQQWELILPTALWDNEKFGNEESKICFQNANCITDNLISIIKKAVLNNDRKMLSQDFKNVSVLRVNDSQMTKLDKGVTGFRKLVRINLCGNFLKGIEDNCFPHGLRVLELQSNMIENVETFANNLPPGLLYLGLAKNLLRDNMNGLNKIPDSVTVLDLSENDIYDLESVLTALSTLPSLVSLQLAGNPCSVCAAYSRTVLSKLPQLQWLDLREILPADRPEEELETHPDDLRSAYFYFTIFRVISAPQPPKVDKVSAELIKATGKTIVTTNEGAITSFHVELELPLLDANRRRFLMFRNNESLIEMLPPPEDDIYPEPSKVASIIKSKSGIEGEASSHGSDVFHLTTVNSREIRHYTTFESSKVQWNKIMNFQEPAVRIFCPNLFALRDTFRTIVTVRLVYTMSIPTKQGKIEKKSGQSMKPLPTEQRATIATIKCALKRPDWSQPSQHFHWNESLDTADAIHWGDGDLSTVQYNQNPAKVTKGKMDADQGSSRQQPPENLTCHFGFGIETLRP